MGLLKYHVCVCTFATLTALVVLPGCARTISADLEAADHYKCLDYGAQPGSDAYVQCRAQLASAHETADATARAARNTPVAPTCDTQPERAGCLQLTGM